MKEKKLHENSYCFQITIQIESTRKIRGKRLDVKHVMAHQFLIERYILQRYSNLVWHHRLFSAKKEKISTLLLLFHGLTPSSTKTKN